jgi:hypothetical protein
VRFLLPISVKGGVLVEEPETPVADKGRVNRARALPQFAIATTAGAAVLAGQV